MFLELDQLKTKHNLNITGILHVGAHLLEELEVYERLSIENIIWIEANPELVAHTKSLYPNQKILNYTVYDQDDIAMTFNIANNGQSSSLLKFGTHSTLYPGIVYSNKIEVATKTIKTVIEDNSIDMSKYNMLNLDIQGVELKALVGMKQYLSYIDYIYTEVNDDQVYENNDTIQDIDSFLTTNGFTRVETFIINGNWGDALYIRQA